VACSLGGEEALQKQEPFGVMADTTMCGGIEALTATLQSERKWRNVQAVLPEALGLVARALAEQTQLALKLQQRVEALERPQSAVVSSDHLAAVEERLRLDAKRRMSRLRKEVGHRLQPGIQDDKNAERLVHSV